LRSVAAVFASLALLGACGKKGPPLPPLYLAPEAPRAVTARRLGDTVYLQMTVPSKSAAGPGPYSVDHIDVYAVTLAPGSVPPPNRDLLKPEHVIAKVAVRPPPDPDAEPAADDTRPLPGDVVTFVEKITPAQLEPQNITRPVKVKEEKVPKRPATSATTTAAPAVPAPPVGPLVLTRFYVVQGVSAKRRGGPASARIEVPLLSAPGAVRAGKSSADETSVTVAWEPPPSLSDEAPGVLYNVYAVPAAGTAATGVPAVAPMPLNEKPLEVTTFSRPGAEAGKEQCFVVRSVAAVGTATIEGDPSDPICVTPKDTFPPAAPKGLAAVSGSGVVNLIWDPSTEGDLAGYVILRGDAPGDTLQPLTPQPIRETRYNDRTVKPGVAYVYAIVAVDRAGNRSALSTKVQETAR
jgi:predicted small lipoprotein YifL